MICPNPDRFAHEGKPPQAVVRQGSIAALYEELGGRVVYLGKPAALAYETAMHHFHHHHICNTEAAIAASPKPQINQKTKSTSHHATSTSSAPTVSSPIRLFFWG